MEKLENVNWRSYDKRCAQRRIFKFWCRAPKRSRSHTGFENRIFKNEKKKKKLVHDNLKLDETCSEFSKKV